jgi:hypothetical protein
MRIQHTVESLQELLLKNEYFRYIQSVFENNKVSNSIYLVGGSVIDIIHNKKSKDFDLIVVSPKRVCEYLLQQGFSFQYATKTAYTFIDKSTGNIIQILKAKDTNEFDYTINQTYVNIKSAKIEFVDLLSLNTGILIPTENTFRNKNKAKQAYRRRLKMKSKGFVLPKMTRKSIAPSLLSNIIEWFKSESTDES